MVTKSVRLRSLPPALDAGENRRFYATLAAAVLILGVMALPLFSGLVYVHDDLGSQYLPFRFFYSRSLAAGDSFIWLPHVFCGYYLHGDGTVGMYHPFHLILYSTLPLGIACNLEFLFTYAFMMLGMFLFLRRWSVLRDASMFGALVFTFSGYNLLHYIHPNAIAGAAHLPWLLLAIDVAMRDSDRRRVALAGLSIVLLTASQLLVSHPQHFWFSSLTEALYVLLLVSSRREIARLPLLITAKGLGVLVGGVQLFPLLDAVSNSVRAEPSLDFLTWRSLHPANFLQLVGPYLFRDRVFGDNMHELGIYNGAIPLALLLLLVLRIRELGRLRRLATGALGLGVLSLVLAMGKYGYLYRLQTLLPFLGLFRAPSRYTLLFHFAMAIGAAVAFSELSALAQQRERLAWRTLWPLGLAPLASVLPVIFLFWADGHLDPATAQKIFRHIALQNLVLVGPVLLTLATALVVAASRGSRVALAGVILFAAADLGVYGLSYIWSNPPTDIESFTDSVPMPPDGSGHRIQSTENVLIMKGARLASGYVALEPKRRLDDESEARLRLANVSWVWTKRGGPLYGRFFGYRVSDPLPRVRLVSRAVVSSDPGRDIDSIDIESTALVSEELGLPGGEPGRAAIVSDRPGSIKVATEAGSKQLLVLSEAYHDGWRARVDGEEREVMRVYGDFMGCVVDAGRHKVEFSFRPTSLRVGAWVSALGLGLALVFFLILLFPRAGQSRIDGLDRLGP